MKLKFSFFWLTVVFCTKLFAQDFTGFVKKNDSTSSPIYQANVQVLESGVVVGTLKTAQNGSFKFNTAHPTNPKNPAFSFRITYPGYTDTTVTIMVDMKGNPMPASVTVKLRKDGMRLMGAIKSDDQNFPIKDVTIVVRNVMTRKEERQTTAADGAFNFKLEYETNYRISIDKRSKGVYNKYRDTTFYVSTVGFNKPLDYPLDIYLTLADASEHVEMPDGYNAANVSTKGPLKPVVQVKGANGKPVTSATNAKPTYSVAKSLPPEQTDLSIPKAPKDSVGKPNAASSTTQPVVNNQLRDLERKNKAIQETIKLLQDSIAKL